MEWADGWVKWCGRQHDGTPAGQVDSLCSVHCYQGGAGAQETQAPERGHLSPVCSPPAAPSRGPRRQTDAVGHTDTSVSACLPPPSQGPGDRLAFLLFEFLCFTSLLSPPPPSFSSSPSSAHSNDFT